MPLTIRNRLQGVSPQAVLKWWKRQHDKEYEEAREKGWLDSEPHVVSHPEDPQTLRGNSMKNEYFDHVDRGDPPYYGVGFLYHPFPDKKQVELSLHYKVQLAKENINRCTTKEVQ